MSFIQNIKAEEPQLGSLPVRVSCASRSQAARFLMTLFSAIWSRHLLGRRPSYSVTIELQPCMWACLQHVQLALLAANMAPCHCHVVREGEHTPSPVSLWRAWSGTHRSMWWSTQECGAGKNKRRQKQKQSASSRKMLLMVVVVTVMRTKTVVVMVVMLIIYRTFSVSGAYLNLI